MKKKKKNKIGLSSVWSFVILNSRKEPEKERSLGV